MSKKYQTKNKAKRKSQKLARKAALKAQYQAYRDEGITKNSRRRTIEKRKGARLAKDNKTIDTKAVLQRPTIGKPPGWINRKAVALKLA